ncbi:hypothetical protein D5R40_32385 [Okeania hirsuta]|uniref:Uncharacterized protein n=1 Tax=Okeania hirsuta TaxID=1458930 RepID=A0A3N6P8C8_9CYAN|nr:hypothetical protein D5R40_32385 [Okeania hirsuta]
MSTDDTLNDQSKEGINNYTYGNAKQNRALYAIFDDLRPKSTSILFPFLYQGFIDKDLKIACFTDHKSLIDSTDKAAKGVHQRPSINLKL